jgi:transmembrane sensor
MRKRNWIFAGGPRSPGGKGPEAAADWVTRQGSDQRTRDDDQQLQTWLAADRANGAAFDAHAGIFNAVGDLADNPEARAILMGSGKTPARRIDRRLLLGGGLAAAAAVTGVIGADLLAAKTYRTEPGEQRRLRLADGSTVMLNTRSQLRVRFDKDERRLFLDHGQAWFQVAKDAQRPFRVFVGQDEVRALGTAFDVRREGQRATVTLEEGKVAIFRDTTSQRLPATAAGGKSKLLAGPVAPSVILSPGDEVRLIPAAAPAVVAVDLAHVQAWRTERVILESTPLGEAVAEFNRYGGPRLVLGDADLSTLPVSGVFHTDRPQAFAEAIALSFPVEAHAGDGQIVLTHR